MNSFQFIERLPSYLVPFFSLSYPTDKPPNPDSFHNSAYYNTGPLDACLIITCIAVMAVLRDAARLGIMEPLARWKLMKDLEERRKRRANGKPNGKVYGVAHSNGHAVHANGDVYQTPATELRLVHRSVLRFAEQGWSVIYYTVQWCNGLVRFNTLCLGLSAYFRLQYVHRNLPTKIFNPTDLWINYPHIPLAAPLKLYYLTQTAFYIHQVLILNAEARRKDHIQMMTHHVITIALMALSYFCNFTRVGCLIMVLMDWCDIFLPVSNAIRSLRALRLTF
jgi:very-long-chain ceramide synthase